MRRIVFVLLLTPFILSGEYVLPKPDGTIPVSIYDPDTESEINESLLLGRVHQACSLLQEDPQGYSEYLFAFFRAYEDVPRDYQKPLLLEINQCGNDLKTYFKSQSPWKPTDIPAMSAEFLSYWDWAVPKQKSFKKRSPASVPKRTKPEHALSASSDAGPRSSAQQALGLAQRFEKTAVAAGAHTAAKGGVSVPNSGKSVPAPKTKGACYYKGETLFCPFEDDIVDGSIQRPDGEIATVLVHGGDHCKQIIEDSISRIEAGEDVDKRQALDQHLQCVDPCLTQLERQAFLEEEACQQECVSTRDSKCSTSLDYLLKHQTYCKERASWSCKNCWALKGVRSNRRSAKGECLAYVKPELPPKPKPKPKAPLLVTPTPRPSSPTTNHTLTPKEISDKSDKIVKLAELSKATGGKVSEVSNPKDTSDAIKSRLTLPIPQKHYQVLFLIDVSGSMQAHVEDLKNKVPELISYAKAQLNNNGQVSFAVRYYVDQTSERPVPLDPEEVLQAKAQSPEANNPNSSYIQQETKAAMGGLNQAINHIQTINGFLEYHWEETVKAVEQEPFSPSPDTEKVIFLITDEAGDIGIKGYKEPDAKRITQSKNIRYEVVMYKAEGMGGGRACTPQDKPTTKTYTVTVDYGLPLSTETEETQEKGVLDSVKSWFKSDEPPNKPKVSAIEAGAYDSVSDDINSKNFPDPEAKKYISSLNQKPRVTTQITLFNFAGCNITIQDLESRLNSAGYRSANLYELLAIGAQQKELQRQFPIAALGSSWLDPSGSRGVPYLDYWVARRKLLLDWDGPGDEWSGLWRFGAVRK